MRVAAFLIPILLSAQSPEDVTKWLSKPLLDPKQAQVEAQVYTASRIPPLPQPSNALQWERYVTQLRKDLLDRVVLRGEAQRWRTAARKAEWDGVIEANGYRVRKFRYEAVPGLWVPGLLYEPAQLSGKAPVVMNVNGHEKVGMSTGYIQERCINLARRGMLAFNMEFLGKGQLDVPELNHYAMPQIDLAGTSGLAVFYLALEKALDFALTHANADPARVAVTGLSGGGWQTTILSALDDRVKLSVPVAGHSSFVTRAQWPDLDLGDSEQTPSDLATLADYLHLSAMMAPKPLMFINNEKDNCCFRADYAMGPLVQHMRPLYSMFGAAEKLRYYINHSNGHNYDQASREELYRFLRDQFYGGRDSVAVDEIPAANEVRTAEQLRVELPDPNATFRSLAMGLAQNLPRPSTRSREDLVRVVKLMKYTTESKDLGREQSGNVTVDHWRIRMSHTWNVPVTEIAPANARETVIVLADDGRAKAAKEVASLVAQGKRVLAVDPMGFGESKMGRRDFLFQMQIASFGERPLGAQAGEVIAIAEWARQRFGRAPALEAFGRRTSLIGLIAAAAHEKAIAGVALHGSLKSLKQIIEENSMVDKAPEMFCFGLLEAFDIPQLAQLVSPRAAKMD
ncbi:MAG: acetylxylan esterase [Bryobacterales bacterium]|nr:acetylxylan esterase [Bryobacterales bacterium]